MNPSIAFRSFDEYSRKARLYPALMTATPALVFAALLLPSKPVVALGPIAFAVGFMFLVMNVTRSIGKRLECRLVREWDGMPTTQMIRYRGSHGAALLSRRRRSLEMIYGSRLPSRRQESTNTAHADEVYIAAVRCLISRVRARQAEFPLVQIENIAYGYARNMLGLKPIALALISVGLFADLIYWRSNGPSAQLWIVVVVHGVLAALWLAFVRAPWVLQAANTYAERLFEALDQIAQHPADTLSASRATPAEGGSPTADEAN